MRSRLRSGQVNTSKSVTGLAGVPDQELTTAFTNAVLSAQIVPPETDPGISEQSNDAAQMEDMTK